MKFTDFLTSHSLYSKCSLDLPAELNVGQFRWPAIMLLCPECGSVQTFTGKLSDSSSLVFGGVANKTVEFIYTCSSCQEHHQHYLVRFLDMPTAMKVGQYPPLDISVERSLSRVLGEQIDNYKKGLICEAHGYGIGAYAYYRRIVESIIDRLLDSIYDLLGDEHKAAYKEALKEVQQGVIAQDKIALVKDLIPASLRPDNMNPLSILHDTLSSGIHAETDEECLEVAQDIREVLVHLVDQIRLAEQEKESSHRVTESMRKLLERRQKSKSRPTNA